MIAGLPAPLADGADPAAGYLATLAGLPPAAAGAGAARRGHRRRAASRRRWPGRRRPGWRWSARWSRAGDLDAARPRLAELSPPTRPTGGSPGTPGSASWRAAGPTGPRAAFSAVYDELPGELAPKLALGFAAEAAGDLAAARHYFQLVWAIDRSCVSAGVRRGPGLPGRRRPGGRHRRGRRRPETSSHHAAAQIAAVRLLVAGGAGLSGADLRQADQRLGLLSLEKRPAPAAARGGDPAGRARLGVGRPARPRRRGARPRRERILGCEPNERALRFGLERGYRALANLLPDRRVELVDMANSVRPRTWI